MDLITFQVPGSPDDLESAPEGAQNQIYCTNVYDLAAGDVNGAQLVNGEPIESCFG